jgi:hypothetical protein
MASWSEGAPRPWALAGLGMQLVFLLWLSCYQFSTYNLTFDFAVYNQAMWLIRQGALNPFSSVLGVTFIRNYGQLLVWPAAVVWTLWPSALALLFAQDVLVVLTNYTVIQWVRAVELRGTGPGSRRSVYPQVVALIMVIGDPWCYETALWDVHIEAPVSLLAVCIAFRLWGGQAKKLSYLVPLLLLCGLTGFLTSLALGVSASLNRGSRRTGLVLIVLGLLGIVSLTMLGMLHSGLSNAQLYGYLGHSAESGGVESVARALLTHPERVARVLRMSVAPAIVLLLPLGVVGVVNRWALPMAVVTMTPAAIAASPLFHLQVTMAFQIWPAIPLILVGTLTYVVRASDISKQECRQRLATARLSHFLPAVSLLLLVLTDFYVAPLIPGRFLSVPHKTAAELAILSHQFRPGDEVIVSATIAGRFAERPYLYVLQSPEALFPLPVATVFLVLAPNLDPSVDPEVTQEFIHAVQDHDHALVVYNGTGIVVLRVNTPPCGALLSFPSGKIRLSQGSNRYRVGRRTEKDSKKTMICHIQGYVPRRRGASVQGHRLDGARDAPWRFPGRTSRPGWSRCLVRAPAPPLAASSPLDQCALRPMECAARGGQSLSVRCDSKDGGFAAGWEVVWGSCASAGSGRSRSWLLGRGVSVGQG